MTTNEIQPRSITGGAFREARGIVETTAAKLDRTRAENRYFHALRAAANVPDLDEDGLAFRPVLEALIEQFGDSAMNWNTDNLPAEIYEEIIGASGNAFSFLLQRALEDVRRDMAKQGDETALDLRAWLEIKGIVVAAQMSTAAITTVDILRSVAPVTAAGEALSPDERLRRAAQGMAAGLRFGAQNLAGRLAGWRKRWHTADDADVRPEHQKFAEQTIPAGKAWLAVDGSRVRFPHDPSAPLAQVANCRCKIAFLR